jgi:uncharacterized protein involved in response to NO
MVSGGNKVGREPYRNLFLLGLFSGAAGVSLWLLFFLKPGSFTYPISVHGHLMVSGLFLAFVSGFLMTALPRMTGTFPAATWESQIAVTLLGTSTLAALFGFLTMAYLLTFAQFGFLACFAYRRFRRKKSNPPGGFLFVPVGLAWGAGAAAAQALISSDVTLPASVVELSRVGWQQAFLLNLIVGIGSRMIPFLSKARAVNPMQSQKENLKLAFTIMIGLNLSFILEAFAPIELVYGLRAAVMTAAAFFLFDIHKPRLEKTWVGTGLRFATVMMVIPYALIPFWPGNKLALLHLVFIGGFSLVTLMIATRVVLAHGGHSLQTEKSSPFVAAVIFTFVVAAVLRSLSYFDWAAALWLVAAVTWFSVVGRFLLPVIRRRNVNHGL